MTLPLIALVSTAAILAQQEGRRKFIRARDQGGITDTAELTRRRFGFGAGTQGQYGQNTKYAADIVYPELSGQVNNKSYTEARIARQADKPQLVHTDGLFDQGSVRRFSNTDGALAAFLG